MQSCVCGNPIEGTGTQCERCKALRVLGLTSGATRALIDSAYRTLLREWRPEQFADDFIMQRAAEEKLKSIQAAYTRLTTRTTATKVASSEPEEEGTPRRPSLWRGIVWHPAVRRGALLAVLVCVLGATLMVADFLLSAIPATAPGYITFKTNLRNRFAARVASEKSALLGKSDAPANAAAAGSAANASGRKPARGHAVASAPAWAPAPHVSGARSYVTLGLTRAEVIAVMGAPAQSGSSVLTYGRSMIFLRNGVVAGWKLDPGAPDPHVKLWPSHAVDSAMESFTTGSTRDEVIAVQGTPTLVTDNKYGYGNSMVYFEGGRVVGWMNDSRSVPLRVHQE